MARIKFDGLGSPIPEIALPPFGSDTDLPSTVLTFTDDAEFPVDQYRALGFTHFEVSCVGAAGGRGSDSSSNSGLMADFSSRTVPQDVWNLQIELAAIEDYYWQQNQIYYYLTHEIPNYENPSAPWHLSPAQYNRQYGIVSNNSPYWKDYPWASGSPAMYSYVQSVGGWVLGALWTAAQVYDLQHPVHTLTFVTYKGAYLIPTIEGLGGPGGGGGFHKINGSLEDLPDLVPVIVGKSGVDGELGQTKQFDPWTPMPSIYVPGQSAPGSYAARREAINAFLSGYTKEYPEPHTTFSTHPVKGSDGGASSFGEVCQASGGVGGAPGMVWDGTKFVPNGNGGAGGIGGRLTAGGGGSGSTVEGVNGSDGVWRPTTGIGSGGGGGQSGKPPTISGYNNSNMSATYQSHLATAGGQGSYSYADTSVYGQRQPRQPWTYMKPVSTGQAYADGTFVSTGLIYVPTVEPNSLIGGSGGGARPAKNLKVGSRASGYSPNGVVVLRLVKI